MAHALHIALSEELGAVDADAAEPAEQGQHQYVQHGVGDGGGGNGLCAQAADHDVVQQGHKAGDKLLDDDGNQQGQNGTIEGTAANETLQHGNSPPKTDQELDFSNSS